MPLSFFHLLRSIIHNVANLQTRIARACRWLTLLMVLTTCLVIGLRLFNIGSVALQESVTYMHALLFMLALAYTAQEGGHVRVDVFYRKQSPVSQAWTNLFGTIFFFLPFAIFLLTISWRSAAQSWAILESSVHPGGLPLVFLLKSLPLAAGVLLSLQAIAEIAQHLSMLSSVEEEPRA